MFSIHQTKKMEFFIHFLFDYLLFSTLNTPKISLNAFYFFPLSFFNSFYVLTWAQFSLNQIEVNEIIYAYMELFFVFLFFPFILCFKLYKIETKRKRANFLCFFLLFSLIWKLNRFMLNNKPIWNKMNLIH